jgi:hypothetical protein
VRQLRLPRFLVRALRLESPPALSTPEPPQKPTQTTQTKPLPLQEKCADLIHPTCYPKDKQSGQITRNAQMPWNQYFDCKPFTV